MGSRGTWGGARVSLFPAQHSIWKSFIEMDDRAGPPELGGKQAGWHHLLQVDLEEEGRAEL